MLRRLSAIPVDKFVLALLLTVTLAAVFPARGVGADVASAATKVAVALLFYLYGARLSPQQAWHGLRQWPLHLMVLTATFVVFPVLGLAARILVPSVLTPELYKGLLFLCLVPSTVQSSIAFTSIARGHVSAAIVSASLSSIVGVVLTPALVMLLIPTSGTPRVNVTAIRDIALELVLPFAVGQLTRRWVANTLNRHTVPTKVVDRGSIMVVVYYAFSIGMVEHIWSSVKPWRVVAVIVVDAALLAVVLTYTAVLGRLVRLDRGDAIVLLFCGSKKSLVAGLPMALVLFPGPIVGEIMVPLMAFHQLQLYVCTVIATRLSRSAVDEPSARQTSGF